MNNIVEISRRCDKIESYSATAINAEMVIEVGSVEKFLTCSWVLECKEDFSFEVTEESIFDLLMDDNISDNDLEKLDSIRKKGHIIVAAEAEDIGEYSEQFKVLVSMIKDKIKVEGYLENDED